jgi:ADP-ribose pyrophosphatase
VNDSGGVLDEAARYPVTASRKGFTGRVWSVRTDDVVLPDSTTVVRDVVAHPGAVGVIALDGAGRVLLVQQYRHPAGAKLWEPPAGLRDVADEPPLETAQRELYEEAGYRAASWAVLLDAFTSPGMSSEAIRVYLARELTEVPVDERFDGSEEERDMPIAWMPLDDAVNAVLGGRLHNPMAVMGILAAARARESHFANLRPADAPWLC